MNYYESLVSILEAEETTEVNGRSFPMLNNPDIQDIMVFINKTRNKSLMGFGLENNIYIWDSSLIRDPRLVWRKYTSNINLIDIFAIGLNTEAGIEHGQGSLYRDQQLYIRLYSENPARILRNQAFKSAFRRIDQLDQSKEQ